MTCAISLKKIISWLGNGDHVTEAAGELDSTWQRKQSPCVWLVVQHFVVVIGKQQPLTSQCRGCLLAVEEINSNSWLSPLITLSGYGGGQEAQRQLWLPCFKANGLSALFWPGFQNSHRIWADDEDLTLDNHSLFRVTAAILLSQDKSGWAVSSEVSPSATNLLCRTVCLVLITVSGNSLFGGSSTFCKSRSTVFLPFIYFRGNPDQRGCTNGKLRGLKIRNLHICGTSD